MTRAEILKVIADNPDRILYLKYGGFVQIHRPTSKTELTRRAAKYIHSVRVSTFHEERPDLNPKKYSNADIVTFDATQKAVKS